MKVRLKFCGTILALLLVSACSSPAPAPPAEAGPVQGVRKIEAKVRGIT